MFHQTKQNPILKKRRTEIEEVESDEDTFVIDADVSTSSYSCNKKHNYSIYPCYEYKLEE